MVNKRQQKQDPKPKPDIMPESHTQNVNRQLRSGPRVNFLISPRPSKVTASANAIANYDAGIGTGAGAAIAAVSAVSATSVAADVYATDHTVTLGPSSVSDYPIVPGPVSAAMPIEPIEQNVLSHWMSRIS